MADRKRCPLCGGAARMTLQAKTLRPCLTCSHCSTQIFSRGDESAALIKALPDAPGPAAAAPAAAPAPAAPAPAAAAPAAAPAPAKKSGGFSWGVLG